MCYKSILPTALAVFVITIGLFCKGEGTETVDLKYYCIKRISVDIIAEKTPVLLIHGLGSDLGGWRSVYEVLVNSTNRNICMVDLRNHGDSPWINVTDTASMAADVAHFVDKKGFEKVNVIGHSLGGKVTMNYTLSNPDRVNSMIIEDMRPNGITTEAYLIVKLLYFLLYEAIDVVPEGLNKTEAQEYIIKYLTKRLRELGYRGEINPGAAAGLELCYIDGKWQFKFNVKVLYPAIKVIKTFLIDISGLYEGPTLFIYGTASPFRVWEVKDEILRLFPKAELFPVKGASHSIHGVYPVFNEKVLELLSRVN